MKNKSIFLIFAILVIGMIAYNFVDKYYFGDYEINVPDSIEELDTEL